MIKIMFRDDHAMIKAWQPSVSNPDSQKTQSVSSEGSGVEMTRFQIREVPVVKVISIFSQLFHFSKKRRLL